MDDLRLPGFAHAEVGLVVVDGDHDEHWRLCDPCLPAGKLGDTRALFRIPHHDQRDILRVHRGRRAVRGGDDLVEHGIADRIGLVAADAAVGLLDAQGVVHGWFSG